MINLIKAWGMSIAGAAILGSIFEIFMPEGDMKKYVRTALGLVLMCIIVKPLNQDLKVLFEEREFSQNYQFHVPKYEDKNREEISKIYINKLSKEIEKSVRDVVGVEIGAVPNIETVDTEKFGHIFEVEIYSNVENNKMLRKEGEIKKLINEKFGVPKEKIKLKK